VVKSRGNRDGTKFLRFRSQSGERVPTSNPSEGKRGKKRRPISSSKRPCGSPIEAETGRLTCGHPFCRLWYTKKKERSKGKKKSTRLLPQGGERRSICQGERVVVNLRRSTRSEERIRRTDEGGGAVEQVTPHRGRGCRSSISLLKRAQRRKREKEEGVEGKGGVDASGGSEGKDYFSSWKPFPRCSDGVEK